jgi:hypothetical protein
MSLQGVDSYIYWFLSATNTYKGGVPATDKHQPFNPLLEFKNPLVHYTQKHITTPDNLAPNIVFDEKLELGRTTIRALFRDPFLLLTSLTYKGVTTAWTGTGDVITGNFSSQANRDFNIGVQIHAHDQQIDEKKHLNMFFDGGEVVGYRIIGDHQDALYEEAEVQFAEFALSTQPVNITANFDDGSFDKTGAFEISTIVAVAAASITTGKYFTIQGISATWVRTDYYVWFNKDAGGGDPAPTGYTAIEVTVTTGQTDQQVSDAITSAITAKADFGAANGGGTSTTVTVTNAVQGDVVAIADVDSGLTVAVTTQGVIGQNGGWANWDDAYGSGEAVLTKDCTVTWNGSAIPGLLMQSFEVEWGVPKNPKFVASALTAAKSILGKHPPYRAVMTGMLDNNDAFAEFVASYSSKTKGTFKVQYGTTKYVQFTNAYLFQIDPPGGLPPAGEGMEVTYVFLAGAGSVLTYYWTDDVATDPSDHINHTNI